MKRVLIATYGVGHVQMVIPVALELQARGLDVVCLALTTAAVEARRVGLATFGYRDLLRDGDGPALRWGEQLLADSHNPASGIPRDESVAYLGLSYQDLVDRLGEDEAAARYRRYQRHAFFQLGPMRRALERWRPDVVFVTSSPKSERGLAVVAREGGVPAVILDDLLGKRPRLFPDFVPPPIADRVCAGSVIARDNLIAQGTPVERIRITGNPAFDPIAHLDRSQLRQDVRRRFGWTEEVPVLLCAPEGTLSQADLAAALRDLMRSQTDLHIILRRHPSQWHLPVPELAALVGLRFEFGENQPAYPLLAATDAMLAVNTTLAIEALLLGCTILQAGPGLPLADWSLSPHEDLPLFRYGAAELVTSLAEINRALPDAVAHARRSDPQLPPLVPAPGGAAAAVADALQEVVE